MAALGFCVNRQVGKGSLRLMHELPQTRDLATFVKVIEAGGFAEAGRHLGVAPSTLSRAVTRLELQLGATLLRRSTRAIELTAEGRDLLVAAQDIVTRTESLADLAAQGRAPRGPLRVNAPAGFVLHVIAPQLAEFHARFPEVEVTLDMTDRLVDLIDSHADVAIRFGRLADSEVLQRPLGRTPWRLVAAPSYLDRAGWPDKPEALGQLRQVRFTAPSHINGLHFEGLAGPVDVPASVYAENGEAVRCLILGGMGIARLSEFMVAEDIAAGRLVSLFPDRLLADPLEITALYLNRTSGLRRLAVFLEWLSEKLSRTAA